MSACHEELQYNFRIVIVYILLLILSIPSCQARDRNHSLPDSAVCKRSMSRLYTAYRLLLKEGGGGDDAEVDVGRRGKRLAVAETNIENLAPLKELELEKNKASDQDKDEKHSHDTDTHARVKMPRDGDAALPDIVLVKTNASLNSKAVNPKSAVTVMASPSQADDKHAADRRLAELSRVYKKYMGVWKSPMPETKGFNLMGQENAYPANSFRLNALSALVNVVENLKQSNPIDEIAKAINDQMNPEKESLIDVNKLCLNLNRAVARREKANGVSQHSSNVFKRLVPNIRVDVKTGGLYEEYKKKLNGILQPIEQSSVSKADNSDEKLNSVGQCHCDDAKPIIMSVDSDGQKIVKDMSRCCCEASRADNMADEGDAAKSFNEFVPCHCADMKNANSAEANVNAEPSDNPVPLMSEPQKCDQSNKENNLNGGLKPNSKQRQMVWNEVPLTSPGSHRKDMTAPRNRERGMGMGMRIGTRKSERNGNIEHPHSGSVVHSSGSTKNHNQLLHLLKTLHAQHSLTTKNAKKMIKRGLVNGFAGPPNNMAFPEVLVQRVNQQPLESSSRIIDNMARQFNLSPMEVAQRITSSSGPAFANSIYMPELASQASQTNGYQVPVTTSNTRAQAVQAAPNLAPILDKILDRLQILQESNYNQSPGDKLPCCFAEPTDGAPCALSGSWESTLLGIRINIGYDKKFVQPTAKPHCIQPKLSGSDPRRLWRQCMKIRPSEIKERFETPSNKFQMLNVTIEETLPPRPHDILDNLAEWNFTGRAISTLGGPLTFTFHNRNTNLLGTFLGFCRSCGCIDTIFGSWTFCHPSRDCQDITMSLLDRRDVLRRFSLDAKRKERLKEQLYAKAKFNRNYRLPPK